MDRSPSCFAWALKRSPHPLPAGWLAQLSRRVLLQFLFQEHPETQLRVEASMEAAVSPLPLGSAPVPLGAGWIWVGISVVELLVGLETQVVTVWVLKHLFGACACQGNESFCSFEISRHLLAWPRGGDGD